MKHILSSIVLILSFTAFSPAQAVERFDVTTFRVPAGWKRQAGADAVQFSIDDKANAFAMITVYRSIAGLPGAQENFEAAWETIVKEAVSVAGAPQMMPAESKDGWQLVGGTAPFEKDELKGAAVLLTLTGGAKMVNVLVLTISGAYEPAISAFLASITLKKPEISPAAEKPAQPPANSGGLSVTSHYWKQTQNRNVMGGYAGYSSNTYRFLPNNTYKFTQVTFQNYAPKYYVEDEEGTYKVSGNTITLLPKKAGFRTHRSTREDPVLKSGNFPLTTLEYRFEFMDLNNNWTLLLSPLNGMETKRDGHFTFWLEGQKQKTYTYGAVNAAGEIVR